MDISRIKTYLSFDADVEAFCIKLVYENDGIERKKTVVIGWDDLGNKIQKLGITIFDLMRQEKEKFACELLGDELNVKIDTSDYISRTALIEKIKKCPVPINSPESVSMLNRFIDLVLSQPSISLFKQ